MQFVVGATADTDQDILGTVSRLSAGGGIHHAHFSAFRPIEDTPLEGARAAPALREHRLYQADYLLRDYGFSADEVVFEPTFPRGKRADVKEHTGQDKLPVIETADGTWVREESSALVEQINAGKFD